MNDGCFTQMCQWWLCGVFLNLYYYYYCFLLLFKVDIKTVRNMAGNFVFISDTVLEIVLVLYISTCVVLYSFCSYSRRPWNSFEDYFLSTQVTFYQLNMKFNLDMKGVSASSSPRERQKVGADYFNLSVPLHLQWEMTSFKTNPVYSRLFA